jgi:CubicO group peptidase (beta-lactamase class C family)
MRRQAKFFTRIARVRIALLALFTFGLCILVLAYRVFNVESWPRKAPDALGLDPSKLRAWSDALGGRGCVIKNGYVVHDWGSQWYSQDVASARKPVFTHLLFKAVEGGLLPSVDAPVVDYEPCLRELNPDLGYPDRDMRFSQMAQQINGYGVVERPGEAFAYNDFSMALFFDTLAQKVYGAGVEELDQVILEPHIAEPLRMRHHPTFLPFGIKDRPGRLSISVRDFARFGLLYLRRGNWNGEQILDADIVDLVTRSPLPPDFPRIAGVPADMCPGQSSSGHREIPGDQVDHRGSYSWSWWVNGVDREGKRLLPESPLDTYGAVGHYGPRALWIIPSLDVVISYNDADIPSDITFGTSDAVLSGFLECYVDFCASTRLAWTDLGDRNVAQCLSMVEGAHGRTLAIEMGERSCRTNAPEREHIYFDLTESYGAKRDLRNATVTIDYFDAGSGAITLECLSLSARKGDAHYEPCGSAPLTDSRLWRSAEIRIATALVGAVGSSEADFRLTKAGGELFIETVRVLAASPDRGNGSLPFGDS